MNTCKCNCKCTFDVVKNNEDNLSSCDGCGNCSVTDNDEMMSKDQNGNCYNYENTYEITFAINIRNVDEYEPITKNISFSISAKSYNDAVEKFKSMIEQNLNNRDTIPVPASIGGAIIVKENEWAESFYGNKEFPSYEVVKDDDDYIMDDKEYWG